MKKWILLFLVMLMAVTLFACEQSAGESNASNQETVNAPSMDGNTPIEDDTDTDIEKNPVSEGSLTGTETEDEVPVVYMTNDISPAGLMAIYEALGAEPTGEIAVKLSTGETGSNYLRPELIQDLVQTLDATIVECNTAYGGQRSNTAMHYQLAEDHGYTAIANVDIMDEEGSMTLPVAGGDNLTETYVGSHFAN